MKKSANAPDRIFRVGLLGLSHVDVGFQMLSGIMDYSRYIRRWKLRGPGFSPFVDHLSDLSPYDGVLCFLAKADQVERVLASGAKAVNMYNGLMHERIPFVTEDHAAVGRKGAQHLIERGYGNLGFFGRPDVGYSLQMCEAFGQTVKSVAGGVSHVLLSESLIDPVPFKHEQRAIDLVNWVESLPRPIGLMTCDDYTGWVLAQSLYDGGIRVPDEVAIITSGSSDFVQAVCPVALSSVELDYRRQGYLAAKKLDALMSGKPVEYATFVPPLEVTMRQSTSLVVNKDSFADRAMLYIRQHCTRPIGVEDVADVMAVSRRTLEKRLKKATGRTPQKAIHHAQVEAVKERLTRTDSPIEQIAFDCGFNHATRLSEIFKRLTGMTPGRYRQRFGKDHATPL